MTHRSSIVTLIAVFTVGLLVVGCSETIECDAPDEDCACDTDSDCIVTDYLADVTSAGECYATDCICAGPINKLAAERNEAAYIAQGCTEDAEGECDECNDYLAAPMCKDSRCVQVITGGGQQQGVTAPQM
jgi:hypothetical protein